MMKRLLFLSLLCCVGMEAAERGRVSKSGDSIVERKKKKAPDSSGLERLDRTLTFIFSLAVRQHDRDNGHGFNTDPSCAEAHQAE